MNSTYDILKFARSQWRMLASVLTGILLSAAFPPAEIEELAWIALVPLLLAARGALRPFLLGFVAGIVYWIFTLSWLVHVTAVGWILLALYCALYFGLFTCIYAGICECCSGKWWANIIKMFATALAWSGLEWLRSTLLTGFSWNHIGVSQFDNTVMIQIAEWGGVYAVSALIVLMNVALALTITRYIELRGSWGRRVHVELAVALVCVAVAFSYGVRRLSEPKPTGSRSLAVALIQPNIEQTEKWDRAHMEMIRGRLATLTKNAIPVAELVVWPETATPKFLRDSPEMLQLVTEFGDGETQILIGSMDYEIAEERRYNYYNSAFLIDTYGRIDRKYDKRHLVLFGEYVPFERVLPFLNALTPIEGSFRAGTESTIFTVGADKIPAASLICFEDAFPYLAADAVRSGARLLINQTNDAWFDPSCGSRQHLAQSVFRTVENRVPMIRAANTGISAWIDPQGRIRKILTDENGEIRAMGFLSALVPIPDDNMDLTCNTALDGMFGKGSAVVAIAFLGLVIGMKVAKAADKRREKSEEG